MLAPASGRVVPSCARACSGIGKAVAILPEREQIPVICEISLVVEYYSR